MAIDPERLEEQRTALRIVPRHETTCSRCGRRTTDKTGTCAMCRRSMPDLTRLTTEQVRDLIVLCRSELERRRSEINAALEGT